MENSNKLKRINKIKMITLWVICVLVALFFKFSMVTPTYAYYLNNDGNLVSQNLSNIDNTSYNTTSYSSINIEKIYIGQGNAVSFSIDYNDTRLNGGNGGLGFWYGDENFNSNNLSWTNIFNTQRIILNENIGNQNITLSNYTMPQDYLYIICGATYNIGTFNITRCMVNLGSQLLPYEPFGTWYNSDNAYQPLNVAFNGCRVELLNYNVSTHNVVSSTNLTISNSQLITLDNILSLKTIIDNDEDTRYGLKFYLNNPINYILNFQMNNNVYQVYVVLSNSVTGQSYSFEYGSDVENYNLVCNTNNNYYDTILYYTLLSPDYSYFSMYVNTDSVSFKNGYDIGYNEGYDEGYDEGHYTGYNTGIHENGEYQRGYNDGIQQDFESSGFRTLITTILSYPVNMVRESLNFEFMGIHVASIVLFIISLGIVAFVIKRFKD